MKVTALFLLNGIGAGLAGAAVYLAIHGVDRGHCLILACGGGLVSMTAMFAIGFTCPPKWRSSWNN